MTKRKSVLLTALVLLCAVYTLQAVFSSRGGAEILETETVPDRLEIRGNGTGSFVLVRRAAENGGEDSWFLEGQNFPADPAVARRMAETVSSLRLLGTVSAEAGSAAFGLDESSVLQVTAYSGGGVIRRLDIGKTSVTGAQTYAVVDGENSVRLVSGDLRARFAFTAEEVRDHRVFSLDPAAISRITCESAAGSFTLEKNGQPPVWQLASGGTSAGSGDPEKIASWVSSAVNLQAAGFPQDTAAGDFAGAEPAATVRFTMQDGEVTLTLYPPVSEEDNFFRALSSAQPWPFTLSSYTAERYQKDPAEFAADVP